MSSAGSVSPKSRPTDPLHEFHAFSATHAAVLACFALATALACALGHRWRATPRGLPAERAAGGAMLAVWAAATAYWIWPANFRIDEALPIHMCDLTGLIAPLVLLTRWRPLRPLLYFWGIGLSIHGMLTPVLEHGPADLRFWLFWLVHGAIVGTAVYDLVVGRYAPTWRDCLTAVGWGALWLALVLVVNLSLGVNYGYVGNVTPDRPTVIDRLGPWPGRVFVMALAVLLLFAAMWLPWAVARRIREVRREA